MISVVQESVLLNSSAKRILMKAAADAFRNVSRIPFYLNAPDLSVGSLKSSNVYCGSQYLSSHGVFVVLKGRTDMLASSRSTRGSDTVPG